MRWMTVLLILSMNCLAAVADDANVQYFIEVPVVGAFGNGDRHNPVIPIESIERSFEHAVKHGIRHIVLRINSPGGTVAAAESLAELMDRYSDRLYFHALVERGISAAIWPIFTADTIFVTDGAIIGGALPFLQASGHVDVDEKMNSIIAAKLVTRAQHKGHSAVLVRAMMIKGAAAYAWRAEDGKMHIAPAPPTSGANDLITLATENTILTVTATEATEIELARPAPLNVDDLGAELGYQRWHRANFYPDFIVVFDKMFRQPVSASSRISRAFVDKSKGYALVIATWGHGITNDQSTRALNQWARRVEEPYLRLVAEIESNEPEATLYEYAPTGELTEQSRTDWLRRRNAAADAWRRLQVLDERSERSFNAIRGDRWEFQRVCRKGPPAEIEAIWNRRLIEDVRPQRRR